MKIVFLIRSLNFGGAERQLVTLAKGLRQRSYDVRVFVFYPGGVLRKELENAGIDVRDFNKKGRWDICLFLWKLIKAFLSEKPDILHGYLIEPNVIALFFKLFRPRTRVVWGMRATALDYKKYDWFSSWTFRVCRRLSAFADQIIVNSNAGKRFLRVTGFPQKNLIVIQNGIDTDHFRPDSRSRVRTRTAWNIRDEEILIGMVARFDPMKDQENFIEAAHILEKEFPKVRFACIGKGGGTYFNYIERCAERLQLKRKIIWAGEVGDVVSVYNALDIACLSSAFGESFPNVVAEAMACGVPCVATDVGDTAEIIEEFGIVVPPQRPELLASGIRNLIKRLESEGPSLQAGARERIVSRFSKDIMVENSIKALFEK